MSDNRTSSNPWSNYMGPVLFLAFIALIVAIVFAVPLVLAAALYSATKSIFPTSKHYLVLAIMSGAALAFVLYGHAYSYFSWVWSLRLGLENFFSMPYLTVITLSVFLCSVWGAIFRSSSSFASRVRSLRPSGKRSRNDENLLPSDSELEDLDAALAAPDLVVAPPSGLIKGLKRKKEPAERVAIPLGINVDGKIVGLTESEISTHGMVLGSTGSGKSEAIKTIAGSLLDLGWSGMILDLKEDTGAGGMRDWCEEYAYHHDVSYQELRLSASQSDMWFNPLDGMGPDEMRDTILSLQEFDDAHWQALNKELLGQAVNLAVWAHQASPSEFPAPTMYDIGRLLATGNLPSATKKMRAVVVSTIPGVSEEDFRVLKAPGPDTAKSALGFGAKLTLVYDTQAGRVVLRPDETGVKKSLDVTRSGLTYIGLDSQGKADLTRVISSAVLQRMSVYAAQRTTGTIGKDAKESPRFLIVDEANWVDRTIVQNLLSRARGAKISMVLCTQGPLDWIDDKGDDWSKLTNNVNVALIMRQNEFSSAEICADYIGHTYKEETSETVRESRGVIFTKHARDRDGNLIETHQVKETLQHIVEPKDIRRLGVGQAVLRVGSPKERVTWIKMPMRDPKT